MYQINCNLVKRVKNLELGVLTQTLVQYNLLRFIFFKMRETYGNLKLKLNFVYLTYLTDSVGNVTGCSVYALQ